MKVMQTEGAQGTRGQDTPAAGKRAAEVTGLEEIIASSGISPRLWRLYAYFWLVCLFFPIIYLTGTPLTTVPLLVALTGLAIFVAAYFWVMWPYPLSDKWRARSGLRSSTLLPVGMTLLVLFLS